MKHHAITIDEAGEALRNTIQIASSVDEQKTLVAVYNLNAKCFEYTVHSRGKHIGTTSILAHAIDNYNNCY